MLLDAIDQATGARTKFDKVPLGTRAIELPDAQYTNYFLKTFGKPRRESVCECERVSEPNLAQALHTLNGDLIEAKIAAADGRVATARERQEVPGRNHHGAVPGDASPAGRRRRSCRRASR